MTGAPDNGRQVSKRHPPRVAAAINVIAFAIGIACIMLWVLDVDSPVRIYLTVGLFTLGPGSALVQFLKIDDLPLQVGLIFAISGAVDLVLSQILLSIGVINGLVAAILLTAITCIRPIHRRPPRNRRSLEHKEVEEIPT